MYNHYIPQSDGSFRRNPVPEAGRKIPKPPPPPPVPEEAPPPPPPPKPEPPACPPERPLSFLEKLIPKDLDLSDLIIIGILLLLSADEEGEDLFPLLTIALYFLL